MKKVIAQRLADLKAEIAAFEAEYPVSFPIMTDYKIMSAKRELLTELYNLIKR